MPASSQEERQMGFADVGVGQKHDVFDGLRQVGGLADATSLARIVRKFDKQVIAEFVALGVFVNVRTNGRRGASFVKTVQKRQGLAFSVEVAKKMPPAPTLAQPFSRLDRV